MNMIKYQIGNSGHDYFEEIGFSLENKSYNYYVFLHFKSPVEITLPIGTIEAHPGACILYEPQHLRKFRSPNCDLIHNWFYFRPVNGIFMYDIPLNSIFYPNNTDFISERILNFQYEWYGRNENWEEIVSLELELFFMQLQREIRNDVSKPKSSNLVVLEKNFKKIRKELYKNVGREWNIEKMAESVSLSRSRFSILYKKIFNISPIEDIINARTERAAFLLLNTDFKVWQIAKLSGYNNIFHFTRQFKNKTGKTPEEFRKTT